MKNAGGTIRLSATDLSNHLHCGHLTAANLAEARGERAAPDFKAPHLAVLQERGYEHERAYLERLEAEGLQIVSLHDGTESMALRETQKAMEAGVDIIVQSALASGPWFGRPDVLRKVTTPSSLGSWSYEPYDCKLARETKAATILQLSHYADLLASVQGVAPEYIYVVPPSEELVAERYRLLDYAAYFRAVRSRLQEAISGRSTVDPEPTSHCDVCRWWPECDRHWRRQDHLSLTAGISRLQRKQLLEWDTPTMERLARLPMPLPQRPRYGSRTGYERIREQARVQVEGRLVQRPVHELLPFEPGRGFARLPEPSSGDIFFDLESDPFVGAHGREYLFGYVAEQMYRSSWAMTADAEKAAFEEFVDAVMEQRRRFPAMHVYHYSPKEPSALKALMGRYATREDAIDQLLRGRVLVDLHAVTKQALRASVESYSLKALEEFHGFERRVPLAKAKTAMREVEHALELQRPASSAAKDLVREYNADDCYSTESLRDWLEGLRDPGLPRPTVPEDAAPEKVAERQAGVAELVARLTADVPAEATLRTEEQSARWLLANLLDWHRREDKVAYWEKYRLADLDDDELLDERKAIGGLRHVTRIPPLDKRKSTVDEYKFPLQEVGLKVDDDVYFGEMKVGAVEALDAANGMLRIRRSKKSIETHPTSVYSYEIINSQVLADSLFRLGESVLEQGIGGEDAYRSAGDLLMRHPPRVSGGFAAPNEATIDTAKRVAVNLQNSVLAIQGPPGAGKTFTGARMIVELVRQGKRVGVTAGSHKVIRKLIEEAQGAARAAGLAEFRALHKVTEKSKELPEWLAETSDNAEALSAVNDGAYSVVAGTAWLWAREEMTGRLDVLFVDEAGQMSLANALAVAPAAKSLVLLGDPQQLDQPLKGSHPDGAEVSALEHLLDGSKTISAEHGLFLERTWRLHPEICRFTSETFYENRLESREGLEGQRIEGHRFGEAGLRYVPVRHEGNQNCSLEEVEAIAEVVDSLLQPTVQWIDDRGARRQLQAKDILIVAPYNAQVAALSARLPDLHIGTVDKFQGQEAPVVIYSLTTSSPEEAPRGMEFLYSLNRLNVATSRARAMAILVASPRLFDPACATPRQMQLANALCRFAELATPLGDRLAVG